MANEFCYATVEENGEITVRIPFEAIPMLAHHALSDGNYAVDEATAATRYVVSNALTFAREVCDAWNKEAEDGSTPLRRSFDAAICDAVEYGAEGIEGKAIRSLEDVLADGVSPVQAARGDGQ